MTDYLPHQRGIEQGKENGNEQALAYPFDTSQPGEIGDDQDDEFERY